MNRTLETEVIAIALSNIDIRRYLILICFV